MGKVSQHTAAQWEYDISKWRIETTLAHIRAHPRSTLETAIVLVAIALVILWLGAQLYNVRDLPITRGEPVLPEVSDDSEDEKDDDDDNNDNANDTDGKGRKSAATKRRSKSPAKTRSGTATKRSSAQSKKEQ